MLIAREPEIRAAVGLDAGALAAVRAAFVALAEGRVTMPPVLRLDLPAGEMDVKTAAIEGLDCFCLKVSTGFFGNPGRGLPSLGGFMAVLDAATGVPRAMLLDGGYLTDLRTALAGAVAADALARPDARVVAILGAGAQARLQARALTLVRDVAEVRVWARDAGRAAACAGDIARATGRPARAVADLAVATRGADIVVTTTPATEPILALAQVGPGTHVTAMGSDAPHKREVAADLLAAALLVVDDLAQSAASGELRALGEGVRVRAATLGEVLTGRAPGRTSLGQITLCDLTGTGAQDTAIAALALSRLVPA